MGFAASDHEIIRKTAKATFMREAPKPPQVDFSPFVVDLETDSGEVDIGHWGALPLPRQWKDSRAIRSVKAFTHRIATELWDHSVGWKEETFRRDKTGTAAKRAAGMASKAQEWYAERFTRLLESGNSSTYGLCYDGRNLFATNHDESGSNQSNLITQDIVDPNIPTIAEFEANFKAARAALRGLKDDQGNPGNFPNGLVAMVPGNYESQAMAVLGPNGTLGGGQASNLGTRTDSGMTSGLYRGQAEVVVNPWMSVTDRWVLLAKGGIGDAGPLARVKERDFRIAVFDPSNSAEHARNLTIEYLGDAEIGFGYALWQRAVMVLNT
jgi:hypothetical protein